MSKNRVASYLASALAALLLGASLYFAAASAPAATDTAPAWVQAEIVRQCEEYVERGIAAECEVVAFLGSVPETDVTYGAYAFSIHAVDARTGTHVYLIIRILTEGESVR